MRTQEPPQSTQAASSGLPDFDEAAEGAESRGRWTVTGMNGIVIRTLQKQVEFYTLFDNPLPSAHETSVLVETWWEHGCAIFD